MRVHFIDTSVFVNIVDVPMMNDQRKEVMAELKSLLKNKDKETMILPFATIIETGNHIAQNGDGQQRRKTAENFCKIIEMTLKGEAPWIYYGEQMRAEDLEAICLEFPDAAMRGEGFGDLSMINAYNKYKDETPAINEIRIWSLDKHLKDTYHEKVEQQFSRNS
ncbi:MAG: hypothetical protein RR139_11350 [Lachnospiraceae bacterium]